MYSAPQNINVSGSASISNPAIIGYASAIVMRMDLLIIDAKPILSPVWTK